MGGDGPYNRAVGCVPLCRTALVVHRTNGPPRGDGPYRCPPPHRSAAGQVHPDRCTRLAAGMLAAFGPFSEAQGSPATREAGASLFTLEHLFVNFKGHKGGDNAAIIRRCCFPRGRRRRRAIKKPSRALSRGRRGGCCHPAYCAGRWTLGTHLRAAPLAYLRVASSYASAADTTSG